MILNQPAKHGHVVRHVILAGRRYSTAALAAGTTYISSMQAGDQYRYQRLMKWWSSSGTYL